MAQATIVRDALEAAGVSTRIVPITTAGDVRAPDTAWGEGAFVTAIESALLDGRIDVAIHSAKDVPTEEDPRLTIAAYLPRADPRDALVVAPSAAGGGRHRLDLDTLPAGSRVGTDSPRRSAFLLARRSDLRVHPIHGNVDTRLRRLDEGETDALVLASAGLDRLGLGARIASVSMPPRSAGAWPGRAGGADPDRRRPGPRPRRAPRPPADTACRRARAFHPVGSRVVAAARRSARSLSSATQGSSDGRLCARGWGPRDRHEAPCSRWRGRGVGGLDRGRAG